MKKLILAALSIGFGVHIPQAIATRYDWVEGVFAYGYGEHHGHGRYFRNEFRTPDPAEEVKRFKENKNVTSLNFNGHELTDARLEQILKSDLSADELARITVLQLKNNKITALPPEIKFLTALKELTLDDNQIKVLPAEIGALKEITLIGLERNELEELPREFFSLSKIRSFSLENNKMTRLPPEIGNLDNLETLSLKNNLLENIPQELGKLSKLTTLNLAKNQIKEVPPSLGGQSALQELDLENNQLTGLPEEIGQLKNLKKLSLDSNKLNKLPAGFGSMESMETLSLNGNELSELPASMEGLKKLSSLKISGNSLELFPVETVKMASLRILNLESNKISFIPSEVKDFSDLQELYLKENQLQNLPEEMGNLDNLKVLGLEDNLLSTLPKSFEKLSSLYSLRIGNNPFEEIPFELSPLFTRLYLIKQFGHLLKSYDELGFDQNGIHKVTQTFFNPEGLDKEGKDLGGFDREGLHYLTGTGKDPRGFDRERTKENATEVEKEVTRLHDESVAKNMKRISKNYVIETGPFYLAKDYVSARQAMKDFQPEGPAVLALNCDLVTHDPYLVFYNKSVHEDYPNNVENQEFHGLRDKIKKAIGDGIQDLEEWQGIPRDLWKEAQDKLDAVFNTANYYSSDSKEKIESIQTLRKRIMRVYDMAKAGKLGIPAGSGENAILGQVGLALSQNHGRCGDGLSEGLELIERRFLYEGEASDAGLGVKISKILTQFKMDFIRKHAELNKRSSEFQTTIQEVLKQRLLYALGLPGSERQILYPGLATPDNPLFHPGCLMKRFLRGEAVSYVDGQAPVSFEPLNAAKMVALLEEAARAGLEHQPHGKGGASQHLGEVLFPMDLQNFALKDPVLGPLYENFVADFEENEYFKLENQKDIVYKPAFFERLLTQFGYLIPKI